MGTNEKSHLVRMRIANLGCVGPDGLDVALDNIVCLVGQNNTGKSTVLRAYEAAATNAELRSDEVFTKDASRHPGFARQEPVVELWVHLPEGTANVDAKWKQQEGDLLLVRSKWTWPCEGGKPTRATWDPTAGEYATSDKASGLDSVFSSRLPRPFRIGSLDDPEDEHKKLLELVLEPIRGQLVNLAGNRESELNRLVREVRSEAERHVEAFGEVLAAVQKRVNDSYQRVFSSSEVRISISLGDLTVDPASALAKSSHVGIFDSHGQTRWAQQGTGSQRALFWSMLEVRSELNRVADERRARDKAVKDKRGQLKKAEDALSSAKTSAQKDKKQREIDQLKEELAQVEEDIGSTAESSPLPGYMLLIDEPETALHPAAIRAAKSHLYSLARTAGWQVMLSTHHPAFIDPLEDHTTIVRLHRPADIAPPNVYRADGIVFSEQERDNLKALLAFDQSVAEMFFAPRVVVVEGDTEFAAFTAAMNADQAAFPLDTRPLILRARGKWTIPILIRMLAHFKVAVSVVHDVDSPRTTDGAKASGAYSANREIVEAIAKARTSGVHSIHRCSVPDFERHHGMNLQSKDKPLSAWQAVNGDEGVLRSVKAVLQDLCTVPDANAASSADDGKDFEVKLREWAAKFASGDPAFQFIDT